MEKRITRGGRAGRTPGMEERPVAKAKWRKGKWVGKKLSADQKKAQRLWRRADKQTGELCDALSVTCLLDRALLHRKLDMRLDAIEETRRRARKLFPEVSESLCVASCEIAF